jgi:hypothetical protein
MNWTLEVVVVPVSDVDCAKTFYAEQLVATDSQNGNGRTLESANRTATEGTT